MPLHSLQRLAPAAILGLWHRTETPAALWSLLPSQAVYQELLPNTAGPERQAQWLAGRVLVHHLLNELPNAAEITGFVLHNEESGRPWLAGAAPGAAVSLSHSGEWVAALLATDGRVGIDVELIRPKAQRIATRFLSPADLAIAEKRIQTIDPATYFSLLWSAKETLYKLASRSGIIFKEQLLLDDFVPDETNNAVNFIHPLTHSSIHRIPATLVLDGYATRHHVCYLAPAPGYVLTYCYEPAPVSTF